MSPEILIGGVIVVALVVYSLSGGADFGGGLWDLLASGPRADRQRRLIAGSIGPIWEANHVWLILVVVLLFVCFPQGFAAISIALHLPLTIMLIGIVLRGSAFVFRSYDVQHSEADAQKSWRRWSRVFAVGSIVTPIFLGVSLGAVVKGIPLNEDMRPITDFVSDWASPFPIAVGLFVLALYAQLAAIYLAVDAGEDWRVQEDFRTRALYIAPVTALLAFTTLGLAWKEAPRLHDHLTTGPLAWTLHISVGVAALLALLFTWTRDYKLARVAAGAQVTGIVLGWALFQYPYVMAPGMSIHDAAAPEGLLWGVLAALVAGSFLLVPAYWWLYKVFKERPVPASHY